PCGKDQSGSRTRDHIQVQIVRAARMCENTTDGGGSDELTAEQCVMQGSLATEVTRAKNASLMPIVDDAREVTIDRVNERRTPGSPCGENVMSGGVALRSDVVLRQRRAQLVAVIDGCVSCDDDSIVGCYKHTIGEPVG